MLLAMVDSLEHLSTDRHESRCADNARMLAERLHVKLATHLDEEAEILRAIAIHSKRYLRRKQYCRNNYHCDCAHEFSFLKPKPHSASKVGMTSVAIDLQAT